MKVSIGRIIEIDNLYIKVELFENYISSYSIVNGDAIRIGGVSNIVVSSHFVYQIISEKINESKDNACFEKRIIQCNLLGYVKDNEYYEGTDGDTPNIYDIVYMAEENLLKKVYSNISNGVNASIGYYTLMQNIRFEFDINKTFASHILIVGNTGSGKSNTLAKLYESLFNISNFSFKKSKFIIIDTNGEFSDSFVVKEKNMKHIINAGEENNGLRIPIQYIDENNWGLILDATEKTQFPVIKAVMRKLKKLFSNSIELETLVNEYIYNTIKTILNSSSQTSQRLLALEKIVSGFSHILDSNQSELYMNTLGCYHINNGRIVKFNNFNEDSKVLENELKEIKLFSGEKYDVNVFYYLMHLEYLIQY